MATAVRELEMIYLDVANSPDQRVRAINALASLTNSYARLYEANELETRIQKLEERYANDDKAN